MAEEEEAGRFVRRRGPASGAKWPPLFLLPRGAWPRYAGFAVHMVPAEQRSTPPELAAGQPHGTFSPLQAHPPR